GRRGTGGPQPAGGDRPALRKRGAPYRRAGRPGVPVSARTAATAWESLLRAQVHLMRQFEAAKDFAPLSAREYDVLFTLSGEGPMRLRDLNEHVLLTQPSLSRMVERMDKAGLVSRCEIGRAHV